MDSNYELVRHLTSPVVAITCLRGKRKNGMIANSAMRASLSTQKPMVSVYIHKFSYSHDIIFETGKFVMHLLHKDQLDLIYKLGFKSGRDKDKMKELPQRAGKLELPILKDCFSYFECEVANVMDTGGSTCFLGSIVKTGRGRGDEVMLSDYLREAMPDEWNKQYLKDLEVAQRYITERARRIKPVIWRGLKS